MPTCEVVDVGVLGFEGCFSAEVFAVTDLLTIANMVSRELLGTTGDTFRVNVLSANGRAVTAAGGVRLAADPVPDRLDLLVVPGFELAPSDDVGARLQLCSREIQRVEAVAANGVPLASACVGAFLLGEAGLLDGRAATTSWMFAATLARRYPRASVDASRIIIEDAGVTTTAAFSAAFDLALAVIRRFAGDDIARTTSRITLVSDSRQSQSPFVEGWMLSAGDIGSSFSDAVKVWLGSRLSEPYRLSQVAAACNVSTRTLLRRFQAETGETPLDYLQRARVDSAKQLLESSELTLPEIMHSVGYVDQGSFRRLFATITGLTPGAYRRQFHRPLEGG